MMDGEVSWTSLRVKRGFKPQECLYNHTLTLFVFLPRSQISIWRSLMRRTSASVSLKRDPNMVMLVKTRPCEQALTLP